MPLLCSICCQIYFALFYTSESWSTKKSKIILNKLNIKEAQCLFNLYIWFVFRVQCLLFIWVETSSKIKFSSSICTLDNVMYHVHIATYNIRRLFLIQLIYWLQREAVEWLQKLQRKSLNYCKNSKMSANLLKEGLS